jgi:hypothetical protein
MNKPSGSTTDEQVLFLSDIFPTGYMAAENCEIKRGDVIAVWGCGPVGQFAIQSAFLLRALQLRFIAGDQHHAGAEPPELTRHDQAESAGPAGDHHDAAFESDCPPAADGFCREECTRQNPCGRERGLSADRRLAF